MSQLLLCYDWDSCPFVIRRLLMWDVRPDGICLFTYSPDVDTLYQFVITHNPLIRSLRTHDYTSLGTDILDLIPVDLEVYTYGHFTLALTYT